MDQDDSDNGEDEVQKKRWNLNHAFRTDPREDMLRPETFDMIHSRCVAGGISSTRWREYVADIRRLLRKGGWLQMKECIPHIQSENGRTSQDSQLTTCWLSY